MQEIFLEGTQECGNGRIQLRHGSRRLIVAVEVERRLAEERMLELLKARIHSSELCTTCNGTGCTELKAGKGLKLQVVDALKSAKDARSAFSPPCMRD